MNIKLTYNELLQLFDGCGFKIKPYFHQLYTLAHVILTGKRRVMLYHEIGLGKTITALYLLKCWGVQNALIICPNSLLQTWSEEIQKATDFTFATLSGPQKSRIEKMLNANAELLLINYEGLKLIGGNKVNGKFLIDEKKLRQYAFEAVICDESHHLKNPSSLQTKIAHQLASRSKYTILMTGTPIAKHVEDIFGQFLVLDGGKTFGTSHYYFMKHFFWKEPWEYDWKPKRVCSICGSLYSHLSKHLSYHHGGMTIHQYKQRFPKPDRTSRSLLLESAKKHIITFRREDCLDLPAKIYETRYVEPTEEQRRLLDNFETDLFKHELSIANVELHTQKLIQITGGAMIINGGRIFEVKNNPKLEELKNVLSQIERKTIIYHCYVHEATMINSCCKDIGLTTFVVNGTVKDKTSQITGFKEHHGMCVLIAHPRSCGEGMNLQEANYVIFYSNSYIGAILREQAEGRIHRAGQKLPCIYIDIVMKGTIDEVLYKALKNKASQIDSVLDYLNTKRKR